MPLKQQKQQAAGWADNLEIDKSPWGKTSRQVFWDRKVTLDDWRDAIKVGHMSYLPQSIMRMTANDFIRYYGRSAFVKDWPAIVSKIEEKQTRFKALTLDLKWSILVSGSYDLIPHDRFWKLGPRCREFLLFVSNHPGTNIYQAAKALNMHYRRAHDYGKVAVSTGMFFFTESLCCGRKQRLLWPNSRWTVSSN